MAEPFLGELRLMSFVFPPKGWALANGQLLPINQNQPLFALFGTTYGGDGRVNFALPDLRGRVPIHVGSGHTLGEKGGETAHTLSMGEMTQHTHVLNASKTQGNSANPNFNNTPNILAQDPGNCYAPGFSPAAATLRAGSITNVGGGQAHTNMQPFLTLSYCIALQGIFPSQT